MKKKILITLIILILSSCSSFRREENYLEHKIKDTYGFDALVDQYYHDIENIWGKNEILIAGSKDYVRYTDSYQTRSHIDFNEGLITVETISSNNPLEKLRKIIVQTLLMNDNTASSNTEYFNISNAHQIFKEPFLYGQVVNQFNQPIECEKRAIEFANYLLKTCLKVRSNKIHTIYSICFTLVKNHIVKRAKKYIKIVRKASNKYGIDESLILAIMQTESSFNPYAVSRSEALGLMQIMRNTAGKDVFKAKGKSGIPNRSYLFNPTHNIDIGTAYLAILNNIYLNRINNPTSRRYAVITAYNGGAGSVLRTFSKDKTQAVNIINSMSPFEVYKILSSRHPSEESRRYLFKVINAQKNYCHQ